MLSHQEATKRLKNKLMGIFCLFLNHLGPRQCLGEIPASALRNHSLNVDKLCGLPGMRISLATCKDMPDLLYYHSGLYIGISLLTSMVILLAIT